MAVHQGVLCHADQVQRQQSGSIRITNVKFRSSDVAVAVPESGRCRESVQCPICSETLQVIVNSGRRNTWIGVLIAILVLILVTGLGWATFSSIASEGLSDGFSWLPMLLLWGVAPLVVGLNVNMILLGVGPSGRIAGDRSSFRVGGKHEFNLKLQRKRFTAELIIGAMLLIGMFLGYQFKNYQWGTAPDGEQLVQLIGLNHNGSEAVRILRSLGQLDQEQRTAGNFWKRHLVRVNWNESGIINSIQFGESYSSVYIYQGTFPFGLTSSDKPTDLATKLGDSTISEEFRWLGRSKTGLIVELHMTKASYSDATWITDVTVREEGWEMPVKPLQAEQMNENN